jgi:4a-hydroxytetrahydrobiopterin dehydratase
MTDSVSPKEFLEVLSGDGWCVLSDGATAFFPTRSLAASARFVQGISEVVGQDDPRPDLDVRNEGVTARLLTITEEDAGLTQQDLDVAQRVTEVAHEQGLAADPAGVQSVLVIVGSKEPSEVMPFWQAVLGYERRADTPDEDLVDPRDRSPAIWFEAMEEARSDGGGAIHLAVWVPYERAEERVAAALAAGGHIVRDDFAPSWWTLADAAGNEADVSTIKGRFEG